MTNRILFTSPASGAGKTTVVCGILQALINHDLQPQSYKSGPDYIDPMFHTQVIGTPSENLDLFIMSKSAIFSILNNCTGDIAILEGVMGYYDGVAMGDTASAYDLARTTQTPVILILNAKGSALSILAVIKGFLEFRDNSQIKGVILNHISPMLYPRLKELIETQLSIKVYGFLPPCPDITLESRHLGLITPLEMKDLRHKVTKMGELCEKYLDLTGIVELSKTAPHIEAEKTTSELISNISIKNKVPLAIAKDSAFCFYYQDNLRRLENIGFELIPFSPLSDDCLPKCKAIYLGGGYPELYAKELSENIKMREEIAIAIKNGIPTIAECGGFLYLHNTLEGIDNKKYPMVGIIDGDAFKTNKLSRFGYANLIAQKNGLLGEVGSVIPTHQFHYWDTNNLGDAFVAEKPESTRQWTEGYMNDSLYAGFPHIHFSTCSDGLRRFYDKAIEVEE